MSSLDSATPAPSPSGARLLGDDTQHAVAWYHALRAINPREDIESVTVEAAQAGNVDDVVVALRSGLKDYIQVKASVTAVSPASIEWLTGNGGHGPDILGKFHATFTDLSSPGRAPRLQLVTTRSIDPRDPVLTLRDRTDRVAERLRRASTGPAAKARRELAQHLGISEEELCVFLDHLRIRTDASEAAWHEHIAHLSLALGLHYDETAFRLGLAEVRDWVKTSRAARTAAQIESAVARLGLQQAEPWNVLVIQALDYEPETFDAAAVLDWVDYFDGEEARTRRGLKDPSEWNRSLRPDLARAEAKLRPGNKRILVRGMARLPVWFAAGTHFPRTRGYHVALIQVAKELWSSDAPLPDPLPAIETTVARAPVEGGELALSIAASADPAQDVARHLAAQSPDAGHLVLALRSGVGSQSIHGPTHAWGTAVALRDEVRRIAAQYQLTKVHLFLAAPAGLALLLGHVWDRVPDTDVYEDLGVRGYQAAFHIPN